MGFRQAESVKAMPGSCGQAGHIAREAKKFKVKYQGAPAFRWPSFLIRRECRVGTVDIHSRYGTGENHVPGFRLLHDSDQVSGAGAPELQGGWRKSRQARCQIGLSRKR
jgi:hypothetical protein